MATNKQYIGNGKATIHDGVTVTIRMEDAAPFIRKTDSGSWLSFIVGKKQQVDDKGRTHTAFIITGPRPQAPGAVAEPQLPFETPVGTVVKKGSKKLRRISPEEAAKLAAFEDMAKG